MKITDQQLRLLAIQGKLNGPRPLDCRRYAFDQAVDDLVRAAWSSAAVRDRECLPLWALQKEVRS